MMILVLLLGALFFLAFYVTGSFFLRLGIKRTDGFTQHVINFWVGLLLVVSVYAIIRTAFITVLIFLPLILLSFRKALSSFAEVRKTSTIKFVLGALGIYLGMFFLQINFNFGALENPVPYMSFIHPFDGERYIYSTVISFLHYGGVETISQETVLKGTSGVSMYHFVEFWLGSLFKVIFNVKSDVALFYFVFPVFKSFTVLTVYSLFADKVNSRSILCLVIAIVVCFFVLDFLWVSLPMYKAHLRDNIFVAIFVLIGRLLYLRRYDVAIAILMTASVENVLFVPSLLIITCLFYGKYNTSILVRVGVFLILYLLFFYLFKERILDKYFDVGIGGALTSIATSSKLEEIYRVLLLAVLSYPFRWVIAYFVVRNFKNLANRAIVVDLGYWVAISFFVHYGIFALMSNLSIDAWQMKQVALLTARVSLLFLLYELVKENKLMITTVVLLLISDYNYPFAKIKVKEDYDVSLEGKIAELNHSAPVKGLFVDEKASLPEKWALFYYPTHATEYARATDYRMYLFNYDVTGLQNSIPALEPSAQPILKRYLQPLFPLEEGILENIKKYKISVVWISKDSKYLEAFRDKEVFHEIDGYYIYHVDNPF